MRFGAKAWGVLGRHMPPGVSFLALTGALADLSISSFFLFFFFFFMLLTAEEGENLSEWKLGSMLGHLYRHMHKMMRIVRFIVNDLHFV